MIFFNKNIIMKQVALLNIFNYILAYIHLLMKSIEGNWWGQTDGSAIKTAAALPEDLILFPTPMSDSLQQPVIITPVNPAPSAGLWGHLHIQGK